MKNIPVIFIHQGYQSYLDFTVQQASKNNKVFFIGTQEPPKNDNVSFFNLQNYNKYIQQFAYIYENLSTNSHNYELFCFLRWFILKEFMEEQNLDTIFYVDSDVMLYVDINEEYIDISNKRIEGIIPYDESNPNPKTKYIIKK